VNFDQWQYILVLAACLAITAPLEIFGSGVYRQVRRAAWAVLPVAAVFLVWDALAIAADVWTYNPRFVTGIELPAEIPLEELLFFVVIPLCGLLTYNAVDAILHRLRRMRKRSVRSA
jgi:lycopene cyclase domain-containing protein